MEAFLFFNTMFITVITDCLCANAQGRQQTRLTSLFRSPVNFIGVNTDLEAAGNLIDIIEAGHGKKGIILVNVAPRNGEAKKWPNGTPFAYFFFKKTLIISSIDGVTLSLIKKLKLTKSIYVTDLANTVTKNLPSEAEKIINTQFRSLEFLPLLALWITKGKEIVFTEQNINTIPNAPEAIWWTDNFGNCKTTLLPEELNEAKIRLIRNKIPKIEFYDKLKDVPNGQTAVIIGSSGIDKNNFLEIVVQGDNASKIHKITSGDILL